MKIVTLGSGCFDAYDVGEILGGESADVYLEEGLLQVLIRPEETLLIIQLNSSVYVVRFQTNTFEEVEKNHVESLADVSVEWGGGQVTRVRIHTPSKCELVANYTAERVRKTSQSAMLERAKKIEDESVRSLFESSIKNTFLKEDNGSESPLKIVEKGVFHSAFGDVLFLKDGVFDLQQCTEVPNVLFSFGGPLGSFYFYPKHMIVKLDPRSSGLDEKAGETKQLNYGEIEVFNEKHIIPLSELCFLQLSRQALIATEVFDGDHFLGYSKAEYTFFTKKGESWDWSRRNISCSVERKWKIVYAGDEPFKIEVFRHSSEESIRCLHAKGKSWVYESNPVIKLIDDSHYSDLFDIVLLDNGCLYCYYTEEPFNPEKARQILLEQDVTAVQIITDPNRKVLRLKTEKFLHHLPIGDKFPHITSFGAFERRLDAESVDLSESIVSLPLSDDLKDNNLVPIYVEYKYKISSKLNEYTFTPFHYEISEGKLQLKGLESSYLLYDFDKNVLLIQCNDGYTAKLIPMEDRTSPVVAKRSTLWKIFGKREYEYHKIIIKDGANYALGLHKSRLAAIVFIRDDNGILRFASEYMNLQSGGTMYLCGEGGKWFNDNRLPEELNVRNSDLIFTYSDKVIEVPWSATGKAVERPR